MNKIIKNIFIVIALVFIAPILASASISCSSDYSEDLTGKTVTFTVSNTDDVGSYTYTWGGTDGLTGTGSSVSKSYSTAGTKSVSVDSDDGIGGTESATCDVTIYTPETVPELNASCEPYVSSAVLGQSVTWHASVSGGLAPYSITWTGDSGLTGSGSEISYEYSATGTKSATLSSVTSRYDSETATLSNISCSQTLPIYGDEINTEDLTNIGTTCSANDTSVYTNDSVTWTATLSVNGGVAPYFISWYGTDGLSGTGDSIIKSYSTTGEKIAKIISIGASDGQSIDVDIDCSNTVNVRNHGGGTSVTITTEEEEVSTSTSTTTESTATSTATTSLTTSTTTSASTLASTTETINTPVINNVVTVENVNNHEVSDEFTFNTDQNPGAYNQDIANLQNRLTKDGFYDGLISGFFGPVTQEALKNYQAANGLAVTGILDTPTRDQLNLINTLDNEEVPMNPSNSNNLTGLLSAAVGTVGSFGKNNWPMILYTLIIILATGLVYHLFLTIKNKRNK